MLKEKELRIGNLVIRKNKHSGDLQEIELTPSCILDIATNKEKSSFDYFPIELNEKWLSKFDVFKKNGYPYKLHYGYLKMRNGNYFYKYFDIELELPFVHQLQNLYYVLTGNEL